MPYCFPFAGVKFVTCAQRKVYKYFLLIAEGFLPHGGVKFIVISFETVPTWAQLRCFWKPFFSIDTSILILINSHELQ